MDPRQTPNVNDTITINDHNSNASNREATNQEGIPDFPNSSATTLSEEDSTQYIREIVYSYEANFEERNPQSDTPVKNCVVCGHQVEGLSIMTAPCGHTYCVKCVNKLFDCAAEDEFSFPPKCCGQIITQENAERFLSPDIYRKFQERSEEFSTTNRTYCSDPKCVTFISSNATVGGKAQCPACQKLTCTACKAEAHEGDCTDDPVVQSFMTAAAEAGFQQCGECKRMIERTQGCNHITCICGAQFCYLCGNKWKTCECANGGEQNQLHQADGIYDLEREFWLQWAVENLLDIEDDGTVEGIVPIPVPEPDPAAEEEEEEATEPAGEPEAPDYVDELVHPGGPFETEEDLTRYLREDPECEHELWQVVRAWEGEYHDQRTPCDLCAQRQRPYLMQCMQCQLQACFRCGRHRFEWSIEDLILV